MAMNRLSMDVPGSRASGTYTSMRPLSAFQPLEHGNRRPMSQMSTAPRHASDTSTASVPQLTFKSVDLRNALYLQEAQKQKLYMEGYLLVRHAFSVDGQPAHRPDQFRDWTECFVQLNGTVLSLWEVEALKQAETQGRYVPPSFINITDALVDFIGLHVEAPFTDPGRRRTLYHVFAVNSAGNNRVLFCFSTPPPCDPALVEQRLSPKYKNHPEHVQVVDWLNLGHRFLQAWINAIRLASWERSRLDEIYTGALIRARLSAVRTIQGTSPRQTAENTELLVRSPLVKGRHEGWVRARFMGSTEWRMCWMVLQNHWSAEEPVSGFRRFLKRGDRTSILSSHGADPMQGRTEPPPPPPDTLASPAVAYFYESKKAKKPFASMWHVRHVYAVYPSRPDLVEGSVLFKVEGSLPQSTALSATHRLRTTGWVMFMPEVKPQQTRGANAEMMKWIIAFMDAFRLYGRPGSFAWDARNPTSPFFAYPIGPYKEHLFLDRALAEYLDISVEDHMTTRQALHGVMAARMRGENTMLLPPLPASQPMAVGQRPSEVSKAVDEEVQAARKAQGIRQSTYFPKEPKQGAEVTEEGVAEPEPATHAEPEAAPEGDVAVQAQDLAGYDAQATALAEYEAQAQAHADFEAQVKAQAEYEAQVQVQAEYDAQVQAHADYEAHANAQAEYDAQAKAEAEYKAQEQPRASTQNTQSSYASAPRSVPASAFQHPTKEHVGTVSFRNGPSAQPASAPTTTTSTDPPRTSTVQWNTPKPVNPRHDEIYAWPTPSKTPVAHRVASTGEGGLGDTSVLSQANSDIQAIHQYTNLSPIHEPYHSGSLNGSAPGSAVQEAGPQGTNPFTHGSRRSIPPSLVTESRKEEAQTATPVSPALPTSLSFLAPPTDAPTSRGGAGAALGSTYRAPASAGAAPETTRIMSEGMESRLLQEYMDEPSPPTSRTDSAHVAAKEASAPPTYISTVRPVMAPITALTAAPPVAPADEADQDAYEDDEAYYPSSFGHRRAQEPKPHTNPTYSAQTRPGRAAHTVPTSSRAQEWVDYDQTQPDMQETLVPPSVLSTAPPPSSSAGSLAELSPTYAPSSNMLVPPSGQRPTSFGPAYARSNNSASSLGVYQQKGGSSSSVQLERPRQTFVRLDADDRDKASQAYGPHGLLGSASQERLDRSARTQGQEAKGAGSVLVNMPSKPPPPQAGLMGAIHSYDRRAQPGPGSDRGKRESVSSSTRGSAQVHGALSPQAMQQQQMWMNMYYWQQQQMMMMGMSPPGSHRESSASIHAQQQAMQAAHQAYLHAYVSLSHTAWHKRRGHRVRRGFRRCRACPG